jgi:RNA polymerase sigma-70 factor, ECF subfamily
MSTSTNALNLTAGNAQALSVRASTIEQVFRKHFRLVYETALHVTGNPYDADDAVQNTFLQFIRSHRPLDSLESPAGYFRRAAAHQALKIVSRRKRVDLTADADGFEAAAQQEAAASQTIEQQLLGFIQTLKPAAALMIKLRYLEGLSNRKIAEMLGKSESVVAVTLFRLRRRLKKIGKGEL